MLNLEKRINAFEKLGASIAAYLDEPEAADNIWLRQACRSAQQKNGWFSEREVHFALNYWAKALNAGDLVDLINAYEFIETEPQRIGIVMAGNIPMVGFHDALCVILSENMALIKCSSSDDILIPALMSQLRELEPEMSETFQIVPQKLENFDAIIATGSNNSARYFEHYFGSVPNIIRKNRTSIAILSGEESEEEMNGLMEDCFRYFGLGCRNVTKLYLPVGFDLNKIFKASLSFSYLMDNKKYVNNYTYHKALMMMERKNVLENQLILMLEAPSLFSPVSVLNYEFYQNQSELDAMIETNLDSIQCVMGAGNRAFGTAQKPGLKDFADGVDTMHFLNKTTELRLPN